MDTTTESQGVIRQAAGRVRDRLGRVALCRWLKASHLWVGLGGIALIAGLRWFGGLDSTAVAVMLVAGLIAVWLLAGWLWSLARKPSEIGALSIWDERGDWKDTFSSALAFEKKPLLEEGERRHVERAREAAAAAVDEIETSIPAPSIAATWIMPVLMLAFAFSPLLIHPGEAGDAELTDAMREAAEREAARLAEEAERISDIGNLAKDEEEDIERLKEAVDGVADELAEADGKSAREVLEALEERARAAERLADKLGAADTAWASEEMLREMSQHADTADLAAAIRDKNAAESSAEADRLAEVLDTDELTRDTEQRLGEALDRTMQKATEEDNAKPVGEHVGNASRKLGERQPKPAARDFTRLADHFRNVIQREKAQQELKELAEKLREAGSNITGADMEPMKQLAATGKDAQPPGEVQPLGAPPQGTPLAQTPTGQQPGANGTPPPAQPLQAPGLQNGQNAPQGQSGQQGVAAPVPGSQQQPGGQKGKGKGKGLAMGQPGGNKPGGKPAALSAPIPGMNPGQGPSGASLGGPSQSASTLASSGGLEAGNATAELGNGESTPMSAKDQSTVTAQINDDGESSLRAVEGEARAEQAQVERRAAAVDFIQVEEDALDEQALPVSRREHVLKYFTELRERFEREEGGDGE